MGLKAVLLVLFLAAPAGENRAANRCLDCHPPHFAERGSCTRCHGGDPGAVRPDLAHDGLLRGAAAAWCMDDSEILARGTVLRDSLACRRCHRTGGSGEFLATDLDGIVRQRDQRQLRNALMHPASAMPQFALSGTQTDTLIARLLHDGTGTAERPRYRVHFRESPGDTLPVFTRLCGSCHRALTPGGPLGTGSVGPDLSGLAGRFYPLGGGEPWTRDRLSRWLANPRSLRIGATMPPVAVTGDELRAIQEEIASGSLP